MGVRHSKLARSFRSGPTALRPLVAKYPGRIFGLAQPQFRNRTLLEQHEPGAEKRKRR